MLLLHPTSSFKSAGCYLQATRLWRVAQLRDLGVGVRQRVRPSACCAVYLYILCMLAWGNSEQWQIFSGGRSMTQPVVRHRLHRRMPTVPARLIQWLTDRLPDWLIVGLIWLLLVPQRWGFWEQMGWQNTKMFQWISSDWPRCKNIDGFFLCHPVHYWWALWAHMLAHWMVQTMCQMH